MTPIQPELAASATEPDPAASAGTATDSAIERTQKILAIVQGAIEGLQESLAKEDIGRDAGRAYAVARDTASSVAGEARAIGQDPAMQRVGDAASSAKDTMSEKSQEVRAKVAEAKDAVMARAHAATENVKAKGFAVRETASRARAAPGKILADVGEGARGWASAMGAMLGIFVGAAALGITFLAIFAIWLVVALNEVLPDPWGTLVAAIAFGLATFIAISVARSRSRAATESVAEARRRVREDIDYVKRPLQREFGARRV